MANSGQNKTKMKTLFGTRKFDGLECQKKKKTPMPKSFLERERVRVCDYISSSYTCIKAFILPFSYGVTVISMPAGSTPVLGGMSSHLMGQL